MGKDRQERKLRESRRVESDRDQSLQYPGATGLDTPEQARKQKSAHNEYKKTVSILYETVFYISLIFFIYIKITFHMRIFLQFISILLSFPLAKFKSSSIIN